MPKKCTINFNKIADGKTGEKDKTAGKIMDCGKMFDDSGKAIPGATNELTFKEALASGNGAYSILNIYAYDIFKVQEIKKIQKVNVETLGAIVDMLLTLGLWALFLIAYALLVIALLFALFTRAFYMWIIAIFSPLFGLFYYLEGKGKFAESLTKKGFSFTSFISLALVPVYVSAALAFGLLFIKMAKDTPLNVENSTFFSQSAVASSTSSKPGDATVAIGPEKKQTIIEMSGVPVGAQQSASTAANAGKKTIELGATAIGKIVISFLSVAILWMAVMAAL